MQLTVYNSIKRRVVRAGYADEIRWAQKVARPKAAMEETAITGHDGMKRVLQRRALNAYY